MSFEFDRAGFYKRQIVMPEIGSSGQERLSGSTATIVGVGGLGSVASTFLTLAGVGKIRIIDQDTLEMHNIHRQMLFSLSDLHLPKVEAARRTMRRMNPSVDVEAIPANLNPSNSLSLLGESDLIVDGLDNMTTRYIINDVALRHGIPYVFAGAVGLEGNVSVFADGDTPCLECVLPDIADEDLPSCETRGVLGVTTGVIGTIASTEAVKILADIGSTLAGRLLVIDLKRMTFDRFDVKKDPNCPACASRQSTEEVSERHQPPGLTWMCGAATVNINPATTLKLDLEQIRQRARASYSIIRDSEMAVLFSVDGVEVSIFANGRMLIKNVRSEDEALHVYGRVRRELDLA